MSDVIDVASATAESEVRSGEAACPCGSGLRLARCCGLDLRRTPRTPPEGLFAERVGRMSVAYNDGEGRLAEKLALDILELAPGQRDALGALYNICKDDGRTNAASALTRRLAALYPNDITSQMVAAQYFLGREEPWEAQAYARMLVRLAPEAPQSHALMGRVFNALNQSRDAEHHLRRALTLFERDQPGQAQPDVELQLASAFRGQGRFVEAREMFSRLLEAGDNLNLLLAAASLEEADHKLDAAGALLDRAAAIAPNGPRVALGRVNLHRRANRFETALGELEPLDASALGPLAPSIFLERGRILDALGRYDEAFAAFSDFKAAARSLTGRTYGAEAARGQVARLKDFFTEGRTRLLPRATTRSDSPRPIFIVGFPRSGTTLVEQTLASHPAISAGDELQIIQRLAERIQPLLGSPAAYPSALSELWLGDRVGQIDTLRDLYLNEAARVGASDPARRWFTDKMPLNETHLGLISLLFPESPVIHLIRHPLDVVLSVFTNGLTHGFNCAAELETAAQHYAVIFELIQHYRAVMPIRYHAVRYEDLVSSQEAEVRKLLSFIGEEFDPSTLDFHENARPARTASYVQVTEKLYDRSRYRYRNYSRHLQSVVPILEPAIRALGYELEG
jgi:tetratricopeptide (TPR) repeat protein